MSPSQWSTLLQSSTCNSVLQCRFVVGAVTEILVRRKNWSGGPKFQEKWTIFTRKIWSGLGITVRVRCLITIVVYEKDTVQR